MHIDRLLLQVCSLAFHPEGAVLASADEDGVVITWDLAEARKLQTADKHKGAVWSLSYSHGPKHLLASGAYPSRSAID